MNAPQVIELKTPILVVGLSARVSLKNIYQELPKLYKKYQESRHLIMHIKSPWEYISLSKNFDDQLAFDYFTGHVVNSHEDQAAAMENFLVPEGTYAIFPIRCKLKFLLGIKMGSTKRYIYRKWLPKSGYSFTGFEFEYNNEAMHQKSPYDIDLYVGINKTSR